MVQTWICTAIRDTKNYYLQASALSFLVSHIFLKQNCKDSYFLFKLVGILYNELSREKLSVRQHSSGCKNSVDYLVRC